MKKTILEWETLENHAKALESVHLRDLFKNHPERADRFSAEAVGIYYDYSKNKITPEVKDALISLAGVCCLEEKRNAFFAGHVVNATEGRAALHMALRAKAGDSYSVGGESVLDDVFHERKKMQRFCEKLHSGELRGYAGTPIRHIVNIGIGGSDLGPQMVVEALKPYHLPKVEVRFVSNVDGADIIDTLADLNQEETLFIIASKTFTTQETMANAATARSWFLKAGKEEDIAKHFVALSTNIQAVTDFGIAQENTFQFWDWVGGRFSLWSVIGLSIAAQIGFDKFEELLNGAREMDRHFRDTPLEDNLPVLLALIGIWNRNFQNISVHAVLPYMQHLHRFPAFLQQGEMESNGKVAEIDGTGFTEHQTAPILFGEVGTNGQHAFYQLMHQGSQIISSDFIGVIEPHEEASDHHAKLLANFIAQPQALMIGKSVETVISELVAQGATPEEVEFIAPHKRFLGGRPTNSILLDKLTPHSLGALIALYEHKIFCQGVIWNINSFDQWGVELGKKLASGILPELSVNGEEKPEVDRHDASTNGLINRINKHRSK